MRALERFILLQIIDDRWREHLHDMDYLRQGIHLRGFAQIEPIVAYKNEGFEMFTALMNSIWEEFGRYVFHVDVEVEEAEDPAAVLGGNGARAAAVPALQYTGGSAEDQPSALAQARQGAVPAAVVEQGGPAYAEDEEGLEQAVETRRVDEREQIGRNDPCWCGSGKKFKKCHGA
jgi:preprotein translocase subunit SecA